MCVRARVCVCVLVYITFVGGVFMHGDACSLQRTRPLSLVKIEDACVEGCTHPQN